MFGSLSLKCFGFRSANNPLPVVVTDYCVFLAIVGSSLGGFSHAEARLEGWPNRS